MVLCSGHVGMLLSCIASDMRMLAGLPCRCSRAMNWPKNILCHHTARLHWNSQPLSSLLFSSAHDQLRFVPAGDIHFGDINELDAARCAKCARADIGDFRIFYMGRVTSVQGWSAGRSRVPASYLRPIPTYATVLSSKFHTYVLFRKTVSILADSTWCNSARNWPRLHLRDRNGLNDTSTTRYIIIV